MKIKNQKEFKIILGSLYVIAAIFLITYIIALSVKLDPTAASIAGSLGDTIGGLASPFIGTMGVILTFLAFWVQFEANQSQREDIKRERFENKFYELLRLHKENVNEIQISVANLKGRSCFPSFLKEIYTIHSIIDHFCMDQKSLIFLEFEDRIKFSFNLFYNGVTHDSINSKFHKNNVIAKDGSSDTILLKNILEALEYTSWRLRTGPSINPSTPEKFDKILTTLKDIEFEYKPFIGHGSQLGHYFRHVYQMIKFVDQSTVIDTLEKQNYLKTLRAQLSNHEQAILYINSLVNPGKKLWYDKNNKTGVISRYMIDYKLIKNLPFHLVSFTVEPKVKFKEELKKAYPDKGDKWLEEITSEAFEELENLLT
jgi:hypothetical protein